MDDDFGFGMFLLFVVWVIVVLFVVAVTGDDNNDAEVACAKAGGVLYDNVCIDDSAVIELD